MPATAEDIAAGTREATSATWSAPAIAVRYPSARDGTVTPARGYFDAIADAQAVANARGALIGTERRRFAVNVADVIFPDLTAGVPTAQLVDAEQSVAAPHLAARIEIDLETGITSFELFG